MLKYSAVVASIFSLAGVVSACGSSEDNGGVAGGQGANNSGGTLNLGSNGPGTGGSQLGTDDRDGGTRMLSDEQVAAISDLACAGWTTEGEALPAVLQLVVDVSGSMERDAPGSNDSKWEVTRDALSSAIEELGAQTAVGVLYYPNQDTSASENARDIDACVNTDELVPIAPLGAANSAAREALQRSLTRANTGSGTPTHDAYQYALDNGMRVYQSSASKFMLLITDGQPTFAQSCIGTGNVDQPVPEQPIVEAIAPAAAEGIRTFVIGSPGSEENVSTGADARPWLSEAATAGGTATPGCTDAGPNFCHMDMTEEPDFAAALAEGLGEIAGQINTCTYAIPPAPKGEEIDLAKVNLIVSSGGESQLVLPDDMGNCGEGWQLNAEQQIVLCEDTCARVQADGGARVQLLFGCSSDEVEVPK